MSANKFLVECGLGKDTISKLKAGSMPSMDKIELMAEKLGTSYEGLCGYLVTTTDKESIIKGLWATPQRIASIGNGSEVNCDVISELTGYSPAYLYGAEQDETPEKDRVLSDNALFDVFAILDKCPVKKSYRTIQVQISRIIVKNLATVGINQEQLIDLGLTKAKLEYIYNDKKSIDRTINFGLNFSDIVRIRDRYNVSPWVMLTGQERPDTIETGA